MNAMLSTGTSGVIKKRDILKLYSIQEVSDHVRLKCMEMFFFPVQTRVLCVVQDWPPRCLADPEIRTLLLPSLLNFTLFERVIQIVFVEFQTFTFIRMQISEIKTSACPSTFKSVSPTFGCYKTLHAVFKKLSY